MLEKLLNLGSYKTGVMGFAILSLAGCQQVANTAIAQPSDITEVAQKMDSKEADVVSKLEWVRTANAQTDARNALSEAGDGKVEIIGFSGRGKSFPGLTKAQYTQIENRVTYRLAKGTGDTIYGPTQKMLRKELRAYVVTYNTIIYDALSDAN